MGMHDRLRALAPTLASPSPDLAIADWNSYNEGQYGNRPRAAVIHSEDFDRIVALPRRAPLDLETLSVTVRALVEMMSARFRRVRTDGCACAANGWTCVTQLLPAQAWALYEAALADGLIAPIGVGHGKTGLDLLLAMAIVDVKLAVLLIPPGLRGQLQREYMRWREHWHLPSIRMGEWGQIMPGRPVLHVIPYSAFSRPESTKVLESLKPDLIIGDEAHNLRNRKSTRTMRLLRYGAEHPTTRHAYYSGTMTAKSIKDFAHLCALALKLNSPLPIDPEIVERWAAAIDPSDTFQAPPGVLKIFMTDGRSIYQGFHHRLVETPGVVATKAGAIDASIYLRERAAPEIPDEIKRLLEDVRETWRRPDGEELVEALEVQRCLRELAAGFYRRWKFPRGEPEELILRWYEVRKDWNKELREKLKHAKPHLDSPFLCTNAAIRAYQTPDYEGELPVWHATMWPEWREIKDQVYHESEAVWIDEFLVRDAAEWGHANKGIIWYEQSAFGSKLAAVSGLPLHGGGPNAEKEILAETGKQSIIASIKSHGTGRDGLQHRFSHNLFPNPPASGDLWEQVMGRTHRIGQPEDEVYYDVYRHTPEMRDAIDRAVRQAKFIEGVMGTYQKLLAATPDFDLDSD